MALVSNRFRINTHLAEFVNTLRILRTNVLKIDADSVRGGWVLWWHHEGDQSSTETLQTKSFTSRNDVTAFVADSAIAAAQILKIDVDSTDDSWAIFWWSASEPVSSDTPGETESPGGF